MEITREQSEATASELKVARRLAAEDISVGDDVALSEVSYQYPSFLWTGADTAMLPPDRKVRITFLPFEDIRPLKIKSVCLPFILCETLNGKHKVFDVRQIQLVKLDKGFAEEVRNAFEENRKTKNDKKKRLKKSK